MDKNPEIERINGVMLDEMVDRVHPIMVAAFGHMQAPTRESVRKSLEFAVEVLETHPEAPQTHGQISLVRTSFGFDVRLHLGHLNHFSKKEN